MILQGGDILNFGWVYNLDAAEEKFTQHHCFT